MKTTGYKSPPNTIFPGWWRAVKEFVISRENIFRKYIQKKKHRENCFVWLTTIFSLQSLLISINIHMVTAWSRVEWNLSLFLYLSSLSVITVPKITKKKSFVKSKVFTEMWFKKEKKLTEKNWESESCSILTSVARESRRIGR